MSHIAGVSDRTGLPCDNWTGFHAARDPKVHDLAGELEHRIPPDPFSVFPISIHATHPFGDDDVHLVHRQLYLLHLTKETSAAPAAQ